jgi:hypothetical protein
MGFWHWFFVCWGIHSIIDLSTRSFKSLEEDLDYVRYPTTEDQKFNKWFCIFRGFLAYTMISFALYSGGVLAN